MVVGVSLIVVTVEEIETLQVWFAGGAKVAQPPFAGRCGGVAQTVGDHRSNWPRVLFDI